jgi:dienelactone hydrolase
VAFAADIYGKGVRPQTNEEAAKIAGIYKSDRALMRARANAALDVLKGQPNVDVSKIAAMGYCFGGTAVLELARSGAELRGIVTFHGGLDSPTPGDGKNIKAKVLVLRGAADPFVSRENIEAFKKELTAAKVDWREEVYPGAGHSFTVPEAGNDLKQGMAYNEAADKKSWEAMKNFFKGIFA